MSDMLEEIRNSVMNIRMVQVQDSFIKFRRIVNDVAKKLNKNIEFHIIGGETELDKIVVEKISDPLLHMLRNSIDHGIETAEERLQTKKNPIGQVNLRAYPDAGSIVIEIEDDGKGIDKQRLLKKAIANGFVSENNKLSDKEICNLIFAAGLSTADEVSNISGRGVGMDVVRRNIEDLRGTIDVESEEGKGSKITIRLPLTLAIIDGFLVQAGKTKYILPLEMIQECIELDKDLKDSMKGNNFINLREEILPILDIRTHFKEEITKQIRENIIVVRYGNLSMGLQVDELFGEHQTVIKPLGDIFENVKGISGGSILGSGEVALIFDIPALMEFSKLNR
jgi:two-component system chemotaxis sensor kinase CheA